MRERVIERYLVQEVKKLGGRAVKLTSSNNRGLPDRLIILPGFIGFIELKAPGRTPTDLQRNWILFIKSCGHAALVIDSRPRVDAFIDWYKHLKSYKRILNNRGLN